MSSNTIYTSPLCSCIICHQQYSAKGIHTHYLSTHTVEGKERSSNNGKIRGELSAKKNKKLTDDRRVMYYKNPNKCKQCGAILDYLSRNSFCSRSCGATYTNKQRIADGYTYPVTDSFREKCRVNTSSRHIKYTKISQCVVCGKFFKGTIKTCSLECRQHLYRHNGKAAAAKQIRRSKDEIELFNLIAPHFKKVTHNEPIANGWDADILIYDTKTAILWNGPWHYREMGFAKHSLKQVQNRDRIKLQEFANIGWNVLIFEDRHFTPRQAYDAIISGT